MKTLRYAALTALFLALALPLSRRAQAQEYLTDEGVIQVGGTASFTSQGGDYYAPGETGRLTAVTLNPSASYFVRPGLAIGGDLFLGFQSQEGSSVTRLSLGPTASYYFGGESEEGFYPFVSLTPLYARQGYDDGDAINGFGGTGSLGLAYQAARNLAFTAEATYEYLSYSRDGYDERVGANVIGVSLGVSGFLY